MIYLDTSFLVRLYFEEPGFDIARELAATDRVVCAMHGQTELVSSFHRKFREGAISSKAYQARLEQFAVDCEAGAFHWLPAGPEVLDRIRATYAGLPRTVYLRAADAMHLATAASNGLKSIYSTDGHLLAAAPHFKLKGLNPIAR